jgi:hypothetical protein
MALSWGLSLCIPSLTHADIYKSVDAQGHVVYSDRATTPAAQKANVVVQEGDPKEAARLGKEQQLLKAVESQRKQQELTDLRKQAQQQREKQQKQVLCTNARDRYRTLSNANHIYDLDAQGNRVYLGDAQIDAAREDARKAMSAACGP